MEINGTKANGYPYFQRMQKTAKPDTSVSFAAWAGKSARTQNGPHIVYMKTDDMLYSGGNGTGLSYYLKYSPDSTEEDPSVIAKGIDENGNAFEQTIHINKINPNCATLVEMRALEVHLGVDKNGGLSSLPPETGAMGLYDRTNFMQMFRQQIRDMNVLKERQLAAYYQYSMQMYQNFINRGNLTEHAFRATL